jgi:hypothetical protein
VPSTGSLPIEEFDEMVAAEISGNVISGIAIALIPLGAMFLAWTVKELRAVTEINATTTQRLAGLEQRVTRIEGAVWRPAWNPYAASVSNPPTEGDEQ